MNIFKYSSVRQQDSPLLQALFDFRLLYFTAKNMDISHLYFSISLCGISTCRTQGTSSISEFDLFLAGTARRLFRLAKEEEKAKPNYISESI